jgi:DNA polymerase
MPPTIPTTILTLDFESFYSSSYNLKALGTEPYVRGPEFEVLGVGVKLGGRPSQWMEEHDFRRWAERFPWERVAVLAQHAHFDGLVLWHHYRRRPAFWFDTLSMSRALHGPGGPGGKGNTLAALAAHYGVGVKGEELEKMKGKRRRDFTRDEWLAAGVYCNNDNELAQGIFDQMALPRFELQLIDATIRMFSEPVLAGNQARLAAAVEEERARKQKVLEGVAALAGATATKKLTVEQAAKKVLGSSPQLAKLLEGLGVEVPMKDGKNGRIYAFASTDPGMHALLEHDDERVRTLAEARIEVKSTLIGARTPRFLATAQRGPMPVYLKFAAAHTLRWGGGDKMNWQNLNRGGELRAAIEAPAQWESWMGVGVPGEPGVLCVADSAQIEPRMTAWLAGQESLLETFRRNDAMGKAGDIYSDEGSIYFRKKLSKETTPIERQTSKNIIIGLGYNMGSIKFGGNILAGMNGSPPVQFTEKECREFGVDPVAFEQRPHNPRNEGGPTCGDLVREMTARVPYRELLVHVAVADYFVRTYRARNHRITALWKSMNRLLEVMADPNGSAQFGPLRAEHERLVKPSGLALRYDRLRRTGDGFVYWGYKEGRMQWVKIYGGALTENVVQSLARDVVAEQLLVAVNAGYRLVTTTHDEGVFATSESHGQRCFELMTKAMKTPPAWCPGLPLNASGGVAHSYGAVK